MRKFQPFLIILTGGGLLLAIALLLLSSQWRPVRSGILFGISGMALVEKPLDWMSCPPTACFAIVHDNKKPGEGRIAILNVEDKNNPLYLPVSWDKSSAFPIDLEAIDRVPETEISTFMAVSSNGKAYYFSFADDRNLKLIDSFQLPNLPDDTNIEGFALQNIDGTLLAVWGHRGSDRDPGIIYWGKLDLNTYEISQLGSTAFTVPWPSDRVRHISDLKVNPAGILYVTSASDPGDDGPFDSAVYAAGVFRVEGDRLQFRENSSLAPLYRLEGHKVEALELLPGISGGTILGTDDENQGSSIYIKW